MLEELDEVVKQDSILRLPFVLSLRLNGVSGFSAISTASLMQKTSIDFPSCRGFLSLR